MNYNIIRIHTPVKEYRNAVEISTLSTIPDFLKQSILLVNHELWLDNENGTLTAPMGVIVTYKKSARTPSGYNCEVIGSALDFSKKDGIYYANPIVLHAMLIPSQEEARPVWVNSAGLTYNDNGTATLQTQNGSISGRIGIDFIVTTGMKKNGKPNASILARYDEDYSKYNVYDENDNFIGTLDELYPA